MPSWSSRNLSSVAAMLQVFPSSHLPFICWSEWMPCSQNAYSSHKCLKRDGNAKCHVRSSWIRLSLKALQKFRLTLVAKEYEICQAQLLWPLTYANGLWWELLSSTVFNASSECFRFLIGLIVWGTERYPDELCFHSNITLSFSHCSSLKSVPQVRVTSNAHQSLSLLAFITTWFILPINKSNL